MDSDSDKTRMIRRARPGQAQGGNAQPSAQPAQASDADATRIIQPGEQRPQTASPPAEGLDNDATRLVNQPGQPLPSGGGNDSDKTQLVRRSPRGQQPAAAPASTTGPGGSEHDPVTGWLVVISGPGKGSQVAIGEQDNHIGRGGGSEEPRVRIGFGDQGISRSNAFVLRYDPKKRRFKVLPGGGTNIIYLNDEDLDAPTELKAGDVIELSETKLRFVPFCGSGFDWADTDEAEAN